MTDNRRARRSAPRSGCASGSVIALDVGGTHIKGAVVAGSRIVDADEWRTDPGRGADAVIDTVMQCAGELHARALRHGQEPKAAGIVVPGLVDEGEGMALLAPNLGWSEIPVRLWFTEHLDLPVAFGHDVRAGGIAESRLGAGRGCSDFAFVPVGTGIAAALFIDGRPHTGAHGFAGELGHLIVRPGGEPCGCGNRGCLEAIASASAIARRYSEITGHTGLSAKDVRLRAGSGDRTAGRVWNDAIEALADGLAGLTALLDLERVIIGGGLARAGDSYLSPLRSALADRLAFRRPPKLVPARLGHRAGCLGAALLAQDLLDQGTG
ncbi:ROK family protein [Streptomyces lavendulocolor]|uniref:ROK family protein n=1 Tax=Streptomyces lavendulocolor TaxID=67316 RepID=UPI003C3092A6